MIEDLTVAAIHEMPPGRQFQTWQLYKAWREIDPETCDRISTPDFERKYPHDEKYKNVIRFAICRAKKLGWIRQIRRGLWERV